MRNMQLRALRKWEFEYMEESGLWHLQIDDLGICWNMETQSGAYVLDNELGLINNWEMLDDIMQNTPIY